MTESTKKPEPITKPIALTNKERLAVGEKIMALRTKNMQKFVLNLLNGLEKKDAFKDAYPNASQSPNMMHNRITDLMTNPHIKDIVEYIKREIVPGKITIAANLAVDTLVDVMENSKSDKARVGASKIVIDHSQGTPKKQIEVHTVNWHGGFTKSFLRDKRKEHMERNIALREAEVVDVEVDDED